MTILILIVCTRFVNLYFFFSFCVDYLRILVTFNDFMDILFLYF